MTAPHRRLYQARLIGALLFIAMLMLAGPATAYGQSGPPNPLDQVGWDQHLGQKIPSDLVFRDEVGHSASLETWLNDKPVVLILAYYQCPNLCPLLLHGFHDSLRSFIYRPGREFHVVVVSINPQETPVIAAANKRELLHDDPPEVIAGWHLLTGDQGAIKRLAQAVGVRYAYDAIQQEFAHPSGLTILTPGGTISRYLYGMRFDGTDLRLGLVEAGEGVVGGSIDQILLRCYHYDPVTGTYGPAVMLLMRGVAVLSTLVVAGAVGLLLQKERHQNRAVVEPHAPHAADVHHA